MTHAEAAVALTQLVREIGLEAEGASCAGSHVARMELHLSGFFSMASTSNVTMCE